MSKIYYICDGKACKHCYPEDCHLTSKIEHAVNFRKSDFDDYVERYSSEQCEKALKTYNWNELEKVVIKDDEDKTIAILEPEYFHIMQGYKVLLETKK